MTPLIGVTDLARWLSVSTRTIRQLRASGQLPDPVRIGRQLRWRREEISRWIEAGCPARNTWRKSA